MFEAVIEKLIDRYLSKFIKNVQLSQIKLALWSGNILLNNIQLQDKIMDKINLPIQISYSLIEQLDINIPWNQLHQVPIQITLQNIIIVFCQNDAQFYDNCLNNYIEMVKNEIIKMILDQKKQSKMNNNYLNALIEKILDNLQINIKNFNVMFQNNIKIPYFQFGFTLNSLELRTMDSMFENSIFQTRNAIDSIHRSVKIKELNFYWNSNIQMDELFDQNNFFSQKNKIDSLFLDIDDDNNLRLDSIFKVGLEVRLTQNFQLQEYLLPQLYLDVMVEDFTLKIQNTQIQDILSFLEYIQSFQIPFRPLILQTNCTAKLWRQVISKVIKEIRLQNIKKLIQIIKDKNNYQLDKIFTTVQIQRLQRLILKLDYNEIMNIIQPFYNTSKQIIDDFPQHAVKQNIYIKLNNLKIQIVQKIKNLNEGFEIQFVNIIVNYKQRQNSKYLNLQLQYFQINVMSLSWDNYSPINYKTIMYNSVQPFLQVTVQNNPQMILNSSNQKIDLEIKDIIINLLPNLIIRQLSYFKMSLGEDFRQLFNRPNKK